MQRWLKRHPQPTSLRVVFDSGEASTVAIGAGKAKWRDAVSAMEGANRVEALNAQGAILRVWSAATDNTSDEQPAAQHVPPGAGDIVRIAELLVRAADSAAARHAGAYQLAYEQHTRLIELLADRLQHLENAYHDARMAAAEVQQQSGPISPNDGMAMAVLSQIGPALAGMSGVVPPPPPPPPTPINKGVRK